MKKELNIYEPYVKELWTSIKTKPKKPDSHSPNTATASLPLVPI